MPEIIDQDLPTEVFDVLRVVQITRETLPLGESYAGRCPMISRVGEDTVGTSRCASVESPQS
jgi:hypothetical protein